MRRARLLVLGTLAACSSPETAPPPPPPPRQMPIAPPADAAVDAYVVPDPRFRLPEGVMPLAYDVKLEIDPAKDSFEGSVEIRVQLAAATRTVWLHAADLEITEGTYRAGTATGALTTRAGLHDLRALLLDREVAAGEVVIQLRYRGITYTENQGLFRQRVDGNWAVFSQGEAAHARRIVPCFDEPRFKVPWQITVAAPAEQIVLANTVPEGEEKLADGRRAVRFASTGPMPSYLLAVAVGPFTIVDGGKVGRNKIPFRVIAWRSEKAESALAVKTTPKIVDALEAYFDQPLPIAKLDFLAVPSLFGAMENPGLVTFDSSILLGDARNSEVRRHFVRVAAHELAHQWMGNHVTPAWWDDLWLSEAFATFVGDKVSRDVDGFDDFPLRTQLDREHALAADAEAKPRAIRHPIADDDDLDETFDAIAYEKGAAVLAMFEQLVGVEPFRAALRAYVTEHAARTAVTADLVAQVARVSTPEVGAALAGHVAHTGTPIVELELRCAANAPVLAAHARDGIAVPVCVRYPDGAEVKRACVLAGDRTELPLAGCPAWLVGNDDGRGYYQIAWTGPRPVPPVAATTPAERLAEGDDVAGAVMRGEIAVPAALTRFAELAATSDPYAALAAVAVASAIDPLVSDADRPAWSQLLARRLAPYLTPNTLLVPRRPVDNALRDAVLALVPPFVLPRAVVKRARAAADRLVAARRGDVDALELALAIAAPSGGESLFDRVLARATAEPDDQARNALLGTLGSFGPELAPRVVTLVTDPARSVDGPLAALIAMLGRPGTRTAAWTALQPHLGEILNRLIPLQAKELVSSFGALCDAAARTVLATELAASAATITDGRATIDRALAEIDRCVARRTAAGDLAAALSP